jgi:glycosyltransferase involved in cell wall biosynthesis
MKEDVDLTVILPVFNEFDILIDSVKTIKKILDETEYKYEIIIAEDGSTDGTDKIAKELSEKNKDVTWLHSDKRLGRGRAVSNAIKKSTGTIVGFIDTDLEISPKYIPIIAKKIKNGYDIVTGRRYYQLDTESPLNWITRALLSKMYIFLTRILLNVNLNDTETGYKFFNKNKVLTILDEIEDTHWFWDTEIMVRSYYSGLKIKEVPVIFIKNWKHASKVNIIKDTVDYFIKLLKFRSKINKRYKFKIKT